MLSSIFVKSLRSTAAVCAGLVLAFIGVIGVEVLSNVLHPFPPGIDPTSMDACRAHVARYPTGVLFLGAMAWALTVFVSSWLATRLGTNRQPAHGIVVGMILLGLAIFNMSLLPYPLWFWGNLLTFPACFLSGSRLGRGGDVQSGLGKE